MSWDPQRFMGRIDRKVYLANRRAALADLAPRFGKHVAWRGDGTGADTDAGLDAELERLGIDVEDVVFGCLDDPNEGMPQCACSSPCAAIAVAEPVVSLSGRTSRPRPVITPAVNRLHPRT